MSSVSSSFADLSTVYAASISALYRALTLAGANCEIFSNSPLLNRVHGKGGGNRLEQPAKVIAVTVATIRLPAVVDFSVANGDFLR